MVIVLMVGGLLSSVCFFGLSLNMEIKVYFLFIEIVLKVVFGVCLLLEDVIEFSKFLN